MGIFCAFGAISSGGILLVAIMGSVEHLRVAVGVVWTPSPAFNPGGLPIYFQWGLPRPVLIKPFDL